MACGLLPLLGRHALVTGSTSGLGLAIAIQLARAGASVALHGLGDAATVESALAKVAAGYERVATLGNFSPALPRYYASPAWAPATVARDVEQLIADVEAVQPLDILVNNAGVQFVSPLEAFPPDQWDRVIALNLSAPFHAMRCALPAMRARGWGRAINIASVHGLVASVDKAAYVASKHGLVGLTKAVALEYARTGVTVNAVCPGWVATPLMDAQVRTRAAARGLSEDAARAALVGEKQPNARAAQGSEVGALCVFLASHEAQGILGSSYAIDGGWTAV